MDNTNVILKDDEFLQREAQSKRKKFLNVVQKYAEKIWVKKAKADHGGYLREDSAGNWLLEQNIKGQRAEKEITAEQN